MKTNTFIFNFINPSRLVKEAPIEKKSEVAPAGAVAEKTTAQEGLKQAEQDLRKTQEEALKASKGTVIDAKNVDRTILNLELRELNKEDKITRNADELERMAENVQRVLGEPQDLEKLRTSVRDKFIDKIKSSEIEKDIANRIIKIAQSEAPADKKRKPEVAKANPKIVEEISKLLVSNHDKFVNFAKNADPTKSWKELNKEFLQALGVTGGSEQAYARALQEVLFGKDAKDVRATDGKLGKYTLAKLQENLNVPSYVPKKIDTRVASAEQREVQEGLKAFGVNPDQSFIPQEGVDTRVASAGKKEKDKTKKG